MILTKYKWGQWTDLAIGTYDHEYYLLQGKRRADGKVRFRVASSRVCWYAGKIELTDLQKLKAKGDGK